MNTGILDCTLRDGGYINDFCFGYNNIKEIIKNLTKANIDIIECGFLENIENYSKDRTVFSDVNQISEFIPEVRKNSIYVGMIVYGKYDIESLRHYDGSSIDGIRLSFHYNEIDDALEYCKLIKQKGYKVFVQPVGTTSYTDEQLLYLIKKVNQLQPFAFYLVDTLGIMYDNDILHFLNIIDYNLKSNIKVGFHSHNNLQMSYSNSQTFRDICKKRSIYLDVSVYGMGRGAGNLNTELIANNLNQQKEKYELQHILEILDKIILPLKSQYEWGYSIPYYLSAINKCHPNYASYLYNKKTLGMSDISNILKSIKSVDRALYNKSLIEQRYLEYQSHDIDDSETIKLLKEELKNKNILIICPGQSINKNIDLIQNCAKDNNCIIISVGFDVPFMKADYMFISNQCRLDNLQDIQADKIIYTSNIVQDDTNKLIVNYNKLLNDIDIISDNAGIMLINLLAKLRVKNMYIAGMDGYDYSNDNFYKNTLELGHENSYIDKLNEALSEKVSQMKEYLNIKFITASIYD